MAQEGDVQEVQTTASREDKKCRQEGCKRPYRAKAYCNVHYKQWRHGKFAKARYKICTKEGCRKPRINQGRQGSLCAEHVSGAEAPAA